MNADAVIDAWAAPIDDEVLELLCAEQAWVDAVFAEIVGPVATGGIVYPDAPPGTAPGSGSARRPASSSGERPGETERSPPGGRRK